MCAEIESGQIQRPEDLTSGLCIFVTEFPNEAPAKPSLVPPRPFARFL